MITALPRRENHNILRNRMTEEEQSILNEIDIRFSDLAEAFKTVNECLVQIGNRLNALEKAHNEVVDSCSKLITVDKVTYKPNGDYEYLSLKNNLDLIYKRLDKLEGKA
jgi:hypothetical protein